jgi:hypothetical protein
MPLSLIDQQLSWRVCSGKQLSCSHLHVLVTSFCEQINVCQPPDVGLSKRLSWFRGHSGGVTASRTS